MQNINHKFSKEIGYTSIKVQELIKNFPDEKFENTTKEQIYKEAKYCHKAQNGIIRISKYVFNNIKNIKKQCLSKQTLEISNRHRIRLRTCVYKRPFNRFKNLACKFCVRNSLFRMGK